MKSLTLTLLSLTLLLLAAGFISCSDNAIQPDNRYSEGAGSMLMKIDANSAPEDVVLVRAELTRSGYQTITAYMNLLSDSSADLTIDSLAEGMWHLKVDALDADSIIKYTGETNVTIIADYVTQLNLVLSQVGGSGFGSVEITVVWGTSDSTWVPYLNNPCLVAADVPFMAEGIAMPCVIFDNGKYKMYFTGVNAGSNMRIHYAESQDGFNWNYLRQDPVLTGTPGTWDSWAVTRPMVLKEEGGYRMYYVGWEDQYQLWHIGTAFSNDGLVWEKNTDPVLYGTQGEMNPAINSVLYVDGVYYMYYYLSQFNQSSTKGLFLATSTDGVNFTRHSGNPLLTADYAWESSGIYTAGVYYEDGLFRLAYSIYDGNALGYAISSDGITFTKTSDQPFLTEDMINVVPGTSLIGLYYPFLMKFGNEERVYFTNVDNTQFSCAYRVF